MATETAAPAPTVDATATLTDPPAPSTTTEAPAPATETKPAAEATTTETPKADVVAADESSILDETEDKPKDDAETKDGDKPGPFELQLPEGFQVNDTAMTEFQTLALDAKLDQAGAQKLMDLYVKEQTALQTKQWNDWQTQQKTWKDEIKADAELGGDKLATNMSAISKTIDLLAGEDKAFGTAVRQALKFTGAGNHPAIVRMLHRAAQQLTEGRLKPSGTPVAGRQGVAAKIYGETPTQLANQMNGGS